MKPITETEGRNGHRNEALRAVSGFSLIELLIVLAVAMVLLLIGLNNFQNWRTLYQTESSSGQVRSVIAEARMAAMLRNVTTVVEANLADNTIHAYADLNGDPDPASTDYTSYLVFDPDPLLAGTGSTDYTVTEYQLPEGLTFGAPNADPVIDGFTTPPPHSTAFRLLVFEPTGQVDEIGSFRFEDAGGYNHLEVALTTLGGKSELRKYLQAADAPNNVAGWYSRGNENDGGGRAVWVWYP